MHFSVPNMASSDQRSRGPRCQKTIHFTEVLNRKRAAIIAGQTASGNNGVTEDHWNRLKTITRQMCRRTGFEMLHKRILPPWPYTKSTRSPPFERHIV